MTRLPRESHGNGCKRGEMKNNFFAGLDPKRRNNGTGDDDLSGAQRFAKSSEKICDVTHDVNQLPGECLQSFRPGEAGDFGAVAKDAAGKAVEKGGRAGAIVRTEDDMALIDVTGERAFDIFRWGVNIGDFDGGTQSADGGNGCSAVR